MDFGAGPAFFNPNHEWQVWLEPSQPEKSIPDWPNLGLSANSAQTIPGLRCTVFADPSAEHF